MCYGINIIVCQGARSADWDKLNIGHSDLIKKLKLRDAELTNRRFVRLEGLPLGSLTSKKRGDWRIMVDEDGTLPSWFADDQEKWFGFAFRRILAFIKLAEQGKFKGSLDLRGTKVTTLGKLTSVGGSLYLKGTKVTTLGKLTSVGGSLDLRGTKVTNVSGCVVEEEIYWNA